MILPCFATAIKEKREIAAMLKFILLSAGDWHIGVCWQDLR